MAPRIIYITQLWAFPYFSEFVASLQPAQVVVGEEALRKWIAADATYAKFEVFVIKTRERLPRLLPLPQAMLRRICGVTLVNTEQLTCAKNLDDLIATVQAELAASYGEDGQQRPLLRMMDYSMHNVLTLGQRMMVERGLNVATELLHVAAVPGEAEALRSLWAATAKEFDVSFCGSMTPRRKDIIEHLQTAGVRVHMVWGFGEQRDAELARATAILNLHQEEDYLVFELPRCSRWLQAGATIITEDSLDLPALLSTSLRVVPMLSNAAETAAAIANALPRQVVTRYEQLCNRRSDINEHLPTLRQLALACADSKHGDAPVVAEMGVRSVVSTWALLLGLIDAPHALWRTRKDQGHGKRLICVDLEHVDVSEVQQLAAPHDVDVSFMQCDSARVHLPLVDMLFIDTWHVYGHLKRELAAHSPRVRKYIAMHDTQVDGELGESIRMGMDVEAQARASGYPREEITRGLRLAIDEFLAEHKQEWRVLAEYRNNNGLTVLERIDEISRVHD